MESHVRGISQRSMSGDDKIIVIGTGPAGAAAAVFLSRAGIKPLVLEAGLRQDLGFLLRVRGLTLGKRSPALRQRSEITRLAGPNTELYEALSPGGLSNHWSCAVPRFSEEDFLDAARGGETHTWPIAYADLEPWYDAVEPLLGIAAGVQASPHLPRARVRTARSLTAEWSPVLEAAERVGRSTLVMPYANGASTMFTRSATPFNAFSQLVEPALRAQQLELRYGADVRRLEWSATERRVVAVHYQDAKTGRLERVPCRAVILAAGAVNSAQIMLQSTSADFPAGLGNQHDVLGRYLNDHPLAKVVIDIGSEVRFSPASYITRPSLERSTPLYAAAFMQWSGTNLLVRSVLDRRPLRAKNLGFSVFGTMESRPTNFVALAGERSGGNGRASIAINLQHEPLALETLERGRDDLVNILEQAGWKPRVRVWKVEAPGNSVHYSGTCRMHASPKFGVVDGLCRVHGVANVAIADSSVFTTGPEKNPVLTAMALAARASDHLAKDLARGTI
jgi:choline dehydrogenase-like flavoprotein